MEAVKASSSVYWFGSKHHDCLHSLPINSVLVVCSFSLIGILLMRPLSIARNIILYFEGFNSISLSKVPLILLFLTLILALQLFCILVVF